MAWDIKLRVRLARGQGAGCETNKDKEARQHMETEMY